MTFTIVNSKGQGGVRILPNHHFLGPEVKTIKRFVDVGPLEVCNLSFVSRTGILAGENNIKNDPDQFGVYGGAITFRFG
jgi:hypothetical protein